MQQMRGHGTERDAERRGCVRACRRRERRTNAVDLTPQRVERMSFEQARLRRMQGTRLCQTALVGVPCRFCELARDRRPHPPRVYREGRIVHGRKDERAVLAHHPCGDPRSIGARV